MKKPYTDFITELFDAVRPFLPDYRPPYSVFAEGTYNIEKFSSQENAILRGEEATFCVDTIHKYHSLFKINPTDYMTRHSSNLLSKSKIAYNHSCCPKNIHRWMDGTVSRKKKCRVEFCTLIYCWAVGWKDISLSDTIHLSCQQRIREICGKYAPTLPEQDFMEVLWHTLDSVYRSNANYKKC